MRKFEKKINELGLEKGKLSKNLNDTVVNFHLAEDELKSLKLELKAAEKEEDNDDEIDKLIEKIEETESQLEQTDDYLVKKIEIHNKNGDMYAARAEKMREARVAKAANKSSTAVQTKPIDETKPAPIVTIKEEVKAQPEVTQTAPAAKIEEEKGTNWVLWGILGVAGIFVGINLFKNKR